MSFNRVNATFFHEEPDQVPVTDLDVNWGVLAKATGHMVSSITDYAKELVHLGLDMVVASHRLRGHGLVYAETASEGWGPRWIDEDTYVGEWGDIRRITGVGTHCPISGVIRKAEDLEAFVPPDPFEEGRLDPFLGAFKAVGDSVPMIGMVHDAFEIPWMMRGGIPTLLRDYYKNPSLAKRLAEMSIRFNVEMAKRMIDEGAFAIISGDDYAFKSGPMMSPKCFKEFILPHLKRLVDAVHKGDAYFIKHTDGNIWQILELLLRVKIDGLHPIEGQADMDLEKVKHRLRGKVVILGNVDCGHILQFGNIEDTARDVKRCMEAAAPGGGYVITSSNTIHPFVKPENLVAMMKATHKYGKYSQK